MSFYNLFEDLSKADREKRKYHAKQVTVSASLTLLSRFTQTWDFLRFDVNWTVSLSTLLAMYMALLWRLDLSGFDLLNLEWDLQLPDLEDLLKGISIKVEPLTLDFYVDLLNLPGSILTFEEMVSNALQEQYQEAVEETTPEKAIYDESICNEAYVDPGLTLYDVHPQMVKAMIRSTLDRTLKPILDSLGWNPKLTDVFPHMVDVAQAMMRDALFLGLGLLGYSKLPRKKIIRGERYAVVALRDGREINVRTVDDLLAGFILGVSKLSLHRFSARNDVVWRREARRLPGARAARCLDRFIPTLQALFFAERPEGRRSVEKSRIALKHMEFRAEHRWVRYRVYVHMCRIGVDPVTANAYASAAAELAFSWRSSHRRIDYWKRRQDLDTLVSVWKSKWTALGLNPDLLDKVVEMVRTCLESLRAR